MKKNKIRIFSILPVFVIMIGLLLVTMSCDSETTEPKSQVAIPEFSPEAEVYLDSVLVNITCETEEAEIYYTLDGSKPEISSLLYSLPIVIDTTTVLKAKAFKEGWLTSEIQSALHEIEYSDKPEQVAAPIFTPEQGNFIDSVLVAISCKTPEASIYYTIDGSDPDQSANEYIEPLLLTETAILKARAYKQGWEASEVASGIYSIMHKVATPAFSPEPGKYEEPQEIVISCATKDALIYYTTDGSEPTEDSILYRQPFVIEETTSLRAKAFKENRLPSDTAVAVYKIYTEPETVATPTFDVEEGRYTEPFQVSIECETPDAEIRYTVTGAEPTENSALYTTPITINAITTLRAKAFKEDWNPSKTAVAVYEMKVAHPTFNPSGGKYNEAQVVEILCDTPGVQIHYTTDGEEPTFFSELYTEPININRDTVVKAIAFKTDWLPSDISTAKYTIDYPEYHKMVLVPYGTFKMGNRRGDGRDDQLPVHEVTIDAFYIGQYQVTQKEWEEVMGENISDFDDDPTRPVDSVAWYWALIYCNRRSIAEGLTPVYEIGGSKDPDDWGEPPYMDYDRVWDNAIFDTEANGYRLPTEAEWEYAARGASDEPDYIYAGSDDIDEVAWHSGNSGSSTQPVGLKRPNSLGIYDMSGNVWEWCWDWYGADYYEKSPDRNPTGPDTGRFRSIRGGSWSHAENNHRVVTRMNGFPYRANNFMGLRIARSLK